MPEYNDGIQEAYISMLNEKEKDFDTAFKLFLTGAQKICNDYKKAEGGGKAFGKILTFSKGKKYIRIIAVPEMGAGKSAWAFINIENGDVLKVASWKAPAKKARGNIYDNKNGLGRITPYGPEYNK